MDNELEGVSKRTPNSVSPIQNKSEDNAWQIIPIAIKSAGQSVPVRTATKQEHKNIIGVFVTTTDDFALSGSTMGLNIDEFEVFPEEFEVSLVNRAFGVSINDLPFKLFRKAQNSKVNISYKDNTPSDSFPQGGYKVNVYLLATMVKK